MLILAMFHASMLRSEITSQVGMVNHSMFVQETDPPI